MTTDQNKQPEKADARSGLKYSTDWAHAKKPAPKKAATSPEDAPFLRAENEDDDGYDPYSDRRPRSEPLFQRNPWE